MNKHEIEIEYVKNSGYIDSYSFSSSTTSDSNGNLDTTLSIVTSGAYGISLVFDEKIFPTSIVVNDIEYENTNEFFQTLTSSSESSATTNITFKKLNKPNSDLILSSITTGIKVVYDDRYIKSISRGSELSTDNELPNYEIVSQYGSVKFLDVDYVVLNLRNTGSLRKPNSIKILLNDEVIGTYRATSWNYDMLNNLVSIDLNDSVVEVSEVEVPAYQEIETTKTLYDVFLDMKSLLEKQGEVFAPINDSFLNRLKTINMYVYRYPNIDLQTLINNFCNVAQCSMYKNENGELGVFSWR